MSAKTAKEETKSDDTFVPMPHQLDAQIKMKEMEKKGRGGLICDSCGLGKCLDPNTKVLMWFGGYKLAKDITVGDLLVGDDSQPRKVLSTCTGTEMMYKISQIKGEDYTVNESHILSLKISSHKAIGWHDKKQHYTLRWFDRTRMKYVTKTFGIQSRKINWYTSEAEAKEAMLTYRDTLPDLVEYDRRFRRHKQYFFTSENSYVLRYKNGDTMTSKKFSIRDEIVLKNMEDVYAAVLEFSDTIPDDDIVDICVRDYLKLDITTRKQLKGYKVGIDYPEKTVKLDPYLLGAWLGDGHSNGSGFTNIDAEILIYVDCILNEEYQCDLILVQDQRDMNYRISGTERYHNIFKKILRDYNLINNKHIPVEFLQNSRQNRLKLLAGLIDTDGYYVDCCYEIYQKNEQLASDIATLARSLGFLVTTKSVRKSCVYKGEKKWGTYHKCIISGTGLHEVPVLLKRKKCAVRIQNKNSTLTGIDVIPIGEGSYCGFEIDGNRRFLLRDFTVTHNTATMCMYLTSNKIIGKTDLIVCPVSILSSWEEWLVRAKDWDGVEREKPKVLVYHGSNRKKFLPSIHKYAFVVTTYATISTGELNTKSWGRVVLDESHYIKNGLQRSPPKCAIAAFVIGMKSVKNWCMTATPLNNRVKDIAAQAMFIGTEPYNDPGWWKSHGEDREYMEAWRKLYVLRRTKEDMLAPPKYHDIYVDPTESEEKLVDALRRQAADDFKAWKMARAVKDNSERIRLQGVILGLIQKLRITSNSYYSGEEAVDAIEMLENNAKVERLINDLDDVLDKDPKKGVVMFSQFTSFLQVFEQVIEEVLPEVEIMRFYGSMNKGERDRIVNRFNSIRRPRVILVSLMAGGVGLSLQHGSSTVMLAEPYYNPFAEQQAEERVHRLGQTDQVNIYRYYMNNSVENWIAGLKQKKLVLAGNIGLVSSDAVPSDFNFDDIAELFQEHVSFKREE